MTSNNKKELTYPNFDEFLKSTNFDFSKHSFENPAICNTLMKMYDQGNLFLSDGDDEKAYTLLIRFFEGVMKLRKTKLFLNDKLYIEKFIPNDKLVRTIEHLEKLKLSLRRRYEEKEANTLILNQIKKENNLKLVDQIKPILDEQISMKKFISPKELIDLIKSKNLKLLLIDIRSTHDFDQSQMYLQLVISEEKKKQNMISYINIPNNLIENVVWNLNESLKNYDKKNSLNKTQSVEQTFSSRSDYDFVIIFDENSGAENFKIDSKLSILKKAIYEYDVNQKLKNEPIILDGGWNQWLIFYPGFTTNSLYRSVNQNNVITGNNSNDLKKAFNFDYPTLVNEPKIENSNNNNNNNNSKPKEIQIDKNIKIEYINSDLDVKKSIEQNNQINKEIEEEKTELKETDIIENISNDIPKVAIPSVDRSNKPIIQNNKSNNQIKINQENNNNIEINNLNKDIIGLKLNNKDKNENVKTQTTEQISSIQKDTTNKPSALVERTNIINNVGEKNNFNEQLFNTVYAPNRYRLIHTPYMKDGSAKVLNNQTGIFSYLPSSLSTPDASQQPTFSNNTGINSSTFTPQPQQAQKPVPPGPKPTESKKSSLGASNLKRTISSPNIAKLEDEILPNIDPNLESEDLEMNKNALKSITKTQTNQSKNSSIMPSSTSSSSIDSLSDLSTNQKKAVKSIQPISQNQIISTKPVINRNSKPMPEHVMRSRIEELDPIFGNVYQGLTGIRNLGNTCFMNSIIQCLSMTEKLVKYFINGLYKNDLNRTNELGFKGQIADEFLVIIQSIWGGHCRIISPKRFKAIIGQFNEQFITNEQQDAQELLLFLLDGLHEDLNRVLKRPRLNEKEDENEIPDKEAANKAWNIHLSINNSIIVDLFQGQFKSTVICSTCNKKSVKFDAFMYLTLPLPSSRCDIYQCFELFLQPERMSGESKWKCPRCKQYRDAIKKIDIWKLPQLLIIHLKRFKYHGLWRDKITTNVDYPVNNLSIDRFVMNPDLKQRPNMFNYQLYATTNHTGTLDGGHYTAMCRHPKLNRWFKFDDTDVKEINDQSSLKSASSYILFYSLN